MFYVYQIFNLVNGKIYIGQTNNIKRRWNEHIATAYNDNKYKYHKLIHKAIRKYGINNFEFKIIQCLNSFQEALESEIYWIHFYQTNIIRYGNEFGYNLSDGGDGGGHGPKSKIHRENISKALIGTKRNENFILNLRELKQKLNYETVREIINLMFKNVSQYKISKQFDVSQSIISDIRIGKSYTNFVSKKEINLLKTIKNHSGEKNGSAKLKTFQVKEIKNLLKDSILTTRQIANLYQVDYKIILRIKLGQTWKDV